VMYLGMVIRFSAFLLLLTIVFFSFGYAIWYPSIRRYRPVIGGVKYMSVRVYIDGDISEPYGNCTIGYIGRDMYGRRYIVSASHCFNWTRSGVGWIWTMHQPKLYSNERYGYIGSLSFINQYVDAAFISPITNTRAKILTKLPSGTPYKAKVVNYYHISEIKNNILKNKIILKTGYSSGVTRGSFIGYRQVLYLAGRPLYYVVLIDIPTQDGDSGGPSYTAKWVFQRGRRYYVLNLIGILSANPYYAWFISVHGIELMTGVKPITYNV